MRALLAFLFLCLAVPSSVAAEPDDRYVVAQAGTSAADVLDARKCPPPFSRPACKRDSVKQAPAQKPAKPRRSDFRADIAALVDAVASAERVPPRVARALVRVESGGNPSRRGSAGEWGLTQIKCPTARGLGFTGGCASLADPAVNLKWGLRHARKALDRGSIGFHQAGLHARGVSRGYVAKIAAAMR